MVHYTHFHTLDPSAHRVSMDLLDRAEREPLSMIGFMLRWMGFNGWLAAVSGCERDYQMINALAAEPRMVTAYGQLIATDPDFEREVDAFAAHWPVLNVAHVRATLGYDAFRRYDRAALLAICDAQAVKRQPANWVPGTPPSWEQLLRTLYQVRCNLFHGEKSEEAARDRDLVFASDRILRQLLAGTGCLGWTDI
jgi:hypothetical protein